MKPTYLKKYILFVYCTILTFQISLQDIKQHENWKLLNGEECGKSSVMVKRILGGDPAQSGEFPWMARLIYKMLLPFEYRFGCGGVLINENYVLTAAHCIFGKKKLLTEILVGLGEVSLTAGNQLFQNGKQVQVIGVNNAIIHGHFDNTTAKHDIALLRLVKPATINIFVKPICLSPERIISEENARELVEVIGWGAKDSNKTTSNKLHRVVVPLIPLEECIQSVHNYCYDKHNNPCSVVIGPGQVCTAETNSYGLCIGDSGGPLMKVSTLNGIDSPRYYLIGVVSLVSCGERLAAYTDVYYYLDWILNHIEP